MSERAPSSKTAAIAGTLAGLLAAGLAAFYLYEQGQANAPKAPGPTPNTLSAPAAAPASTTPATPAAAVPAATPAAQPAKAALSREQAVAALMALPELQIWAARIEEQSGGTVRGALVEYDTAPRVIDGARYYQLSFVENSAESAQRWESFLVAYANGAILVDDELGDDVLSLARWRKEKKPMQRTGFSQ